MWITLLKTQKMSIFYVEKHRFAQSTKVSKIFNMVYIIFLQFNPKFCFDKLSLFSSKEKEKGLKKIIIYVKRAEIERRKR